MGLIEGQHVAGRPGLAELIDEEGHDGALLATETGNGERLKKQFVGMLQVGFGHGDSRTNGLRF